VDLIASSLWIITSTKDQNYSFIEFIALKEKNIAEFSYYSVLVDLIASSLWIITSIKDQNSSFICLLSIGMIFYLNTQPKLWS